MRMFLATGAPNQEVAFHLTTVLTTAGPRGHSHVTSAARGAMLKRNSTKRAQIVAAPRAQSTAADRGSTASSRGSTEGGGRKSVLAKLRFLKKSGSLTGTIASARNQHAELQLKSFQRWWQSHLPAGTISDLELDIRTGVPLLMLLEDLEGSRMPFRWTRVPKSVFQSVDNLSHALDFIERTGIRLLNVSAASLSGATLESDSALEGGLQKQVCSTSVALLRCSPIVVS